MTKTRLWAGILGLVALVLVGLGATPHVARAEDARPLPSVLVVDANLGDGAQCAYHWLGEAAEPIAEEGDKALYTCADASWWTTGGGSGEAPATFVLYGSGAQALTADDVTWALDAIRTSGAEPRTFVVAMGTAGLPVRQYAEDLATQKQSSRADLVGLVFCGTPHNGYTASTSYPESVLWAKLAQSVGLSAQDLAPASAYLTELNAGTFPRVTKTLALAGAVGDLGFGMIDGAGLTEELIPAATLSSQIETDRVDATIGQAVNLTGSWQPFTSSIDYGDRAIDKKLTELLSAMTSYETADEVKGKVRDFYSSWFAEGTPVTHNANVLLLDLSGSMKERIDTKNTKLVAAQEAAQEYLHAMSAVSELPQAAPMDVTIIGFAEETAHIAAAYDEAACASVSQMKAYGETDIGLALDEALSVLAGAPTCATQHILLLSDGESTQGQSEDQIFAGSIAQAKKKGIVVDTIGFGDVGESDAAFLKKVAKETGGTYYTAQDTYSLKVNFLKAYYASLGLGMVDEELASGTTKTEVLGDVDRRTSALEIGVVCEEGTPAVALTCNGEQVDSSLYTTTANNGFTSVQYLAPAAGSYELQLSGTSGKAHVFAVRQQGIVKEKAVAGEERDLSLYLLAAAGVGLVAALTGVVLFSRRRAAGGRAASAAPVGRSATATLHDAHGRANNSKTVVSWENDDTMTKNGNDR